MLELLTSRQTRPVQPVAPLRPAPHAGAVPSFVSSRVDTYFRERAVNPVTGTHILKGRVPGPGAVMVTSNDYLSLARHPEIVAAQVQTLRAIGHGEPRSGVFDFGEAPIRVLETHFAQAFASESALVAQSGWCANTGLLQSIADESTPVYVDMFAHMSLWEGVRSAGATARPFRHNNPEALRKLMDRHGPGVVVVDALYSTTGVVCPLLEMVEATEASGSVIVVDESHSLGVYGPRGAGMVVAQGLQDRVHFRTASLSKAFAARGGLVLCSDRLAEYLRYQSLPAIFSSSLLPHEIAGLEATLGVIQRDSARRERVLAHGRHLRARLRAIGYDVGADETQIIALVAGPEHLTIQLRDALEARGVFGSVFCDPATPRNRSLVRFTLGADHDRAEIDRIADVCAEIRPHLTLDQWPGARRQAQQAA
jgi:CAI-1 autoinducer synthase